jgi:peptidyl-dipeptidase A
MRKLLLSVGAAAMLTAAVLTVASLSAADPAPVPPGVWMNSAEQELEALALEGGRLGWIAANFITVDTQAAAAAYQARTFPRTLQIAREARRYADVATDRDTGRKLGLIVRGFTGPPPSDPKRIEELAELSAAMPAAYSVYEYCRPDGQCRDFEQLNQVLGTSRDAAELLDAWQGWHRLGADLKAPYARFVALANEGAHEMGFADLGALWRSQYDMPPDAFAAEVSRLVGQIRPLYEALHCHVRARLSGHYGADIVPAQGPIPAHVLGNMWAQDWSNVFPLLGADDAGQAADLTAELERRDIDEIGMTRIAERFFTSLGFPALPETFWERSLLVRPRDRDVDCYASAWHVDGKEDVRLKMCVQRNEEDLRVLHHELGHTYYQLAYRDQPYLYKDSANDGFHEAIGDTLTLSMTPAYLREIGLTDTVPDDGAEIAFLLKSALSNVVGMPWTYGLDQWRWDVLAGKTPESRWNEAWWIMRENVQGIGSPVGRGAAEFDPGAKYHVPANVPYTRYFLSSILRFQFHRALCDAAGYEGPLHECSIYGSEAAGRRLQSMLAMGTSRPWQEAMQAIAGTERMDAGAVLDYYAPLQRWLDRQNQGRSCGW